MKCEKCGEELKKGAKFCKTCGAEVKKEKEPVSKVEVKNENIGLGALGALIGSLAGVVAIIGFDYIGFIASVSGLIMGFCTIALYKKFAGSISAKGIIISVIIMIIMTYLAVHLSYTIQILKLAKEDGVNASFADVFKNLRNILTALGASGTYYGSLFMVYLFTALGSFGNIMAEFKSLKENK